MSRRSLQGDRERHQRRRSSNSSTSRIRVIDLPPSTDFATPTMNNRTHKQHNNGRQLQRPQPQRRRRQIPLNANDDDDDNDTRRQQQQQQRRQIPLSVDDGNYYDNDSSYRSLNAIEDLNSTLSSSTAGVGSSPQEIFNRSDGRIDEMRRRKRRNWLFNHEFHSNDYDYGMQEDRLDDLGSNHSEPTIISGYIIPSAWSAAKDLNFDKQKRKNRYPEEVLEEEEEQELVQGLEEEHYNNDYYLQDNDDSSNVSIMMNRGRRDSTGSVLSGASVSTHHGLINNDHQAEQELRGFDRRRQEQHPASYRYANDVPPGAPPTATPPPPPSADAAVSEPLFLEGNLYVRKGKLQGKLQGKSNTSWKLRYVILDLKDGGSISCYRESPIAQTDQDLQQQSSPSNDTQQSKSSKKNKKFLLTSRLHNTLLLQKLNPSQVSNAIDTIDTSYCIPALLDWAVKDIENDSSQFVIEIPTTEEQIIQQLESMPAVSVNNPSIDRSVMSYDDNHSMTSSSILYPPNMSDDATEEHSTFHESDGSINNDDDGGEQPQQYEDDEDEQHYDSILEELSEELQQEIEQARIEGKPLRIYFRCSRSSEKQLWLQAFDRIGRLSQELRRKKGILNTLRATNVNWVQSRVRSRQSENYINQSKTLEWFTGAFGGSPFGSGGKGKNGENELHGRPNPAIDLDDSQNPGYDGDLRLVRQSNSDKEYVVYPPYAYPNRWMTNSELHREMLLPSTVFHDSRPPVAPDGTTPTCDKKEIGEIRVEVLQCIGLPKLDRASETDAVVYMACGSHAFVSDVIWNRLNPIWLPKSRRAAVFPLYHAYARLYVGVFDDDGRGEKDDFAGHVVVSLARCRPGSSYDVTLPLRLSAHVYSKRSRGAIRIRFTVNYWSERAALLSYIPKAIPLPKPKRPDDDVTILCADEKVFRNIALTVHGIHMPGGFSFQQWKATMREVNFTRKVIISSLRNLVLETIAWENPAMSAYIFVAWMHCIYKNSFSLTPAYAVLYLLLHMIRNYAILGIDGPSQNGFIPPTWEEMFMALVTSGKETSIAPLEMRPKRNRRDATFSSGPNATVNTHEPQGKSLFRFMGFVDNEIDPENSHLEFPYSRGLGYTRYKVRDCLVPKTTITGARKRGEPEPDEGGFADFAMPTNNDTNSSIPRGRGRLAAFLQKKGEDKNKNGVNQTGSAAAAAAVDHGDNSLVSEGERSGASGTVDSRIHDLASDASITSQPTPFILKPKEVFPEQNIDVNVAKTKKLSDDLVEMRDNMHRMTLHLFNDRTHVIRHDDSCYFGQAKRGFLRSDISNELDRLLNIGQYSSVNPVVARIGLYVEPLVSASLSFLSLFRALYNIMMWRDPFLSFWFSLLLMGLVLLLFLFPWRLCLFLVGFVLVGPQNWLLRVLHENGRLPKSIRDRIRKLQERKSKRQSSKEKLPENVVDGNVESSTTTSSEEEVLPRDQPIMTGHTSDCTPPAKLSVDDVDPREIHQVCVPYSQLMYNRFYHWPPETQYARVKLARTKGETPETLYQRRFGNAGYGSYPVTSSLDLSRHRSLHRLGSMNTANGRIGLGRNVGLRRQNAFARTTIKED